MSRAAFALIVALFVATAAPAPAAGKPNVVLVVIDDLGQRDLGCYGSTYYRTPNLDALAKQGVRFTDAYASCPVCSPTRVSLLTGKYPQRVGITDWLPGQADRPIHKLSRPKLPAELPLTEVTLAEALKAAGYATAHVGKWHLGGEGFGPKEQGFDLNIAGDHTGTPISYFAPFRNKQRFMPGLEVAPDGEYLTDRLTAEAIKFIEANKDRPFFLYLPHYAVHTPLRGKKELVEKYKARGHGSQGNPVYAAMVESMDESVGRVLKALDDLKLADNTCVIFTSDNGGLATLEGMPAASTFNGPLREGKGYLYEGGVRVPLIVRGPGVGKAGSATDTVTSSIDVFPTVLDVCGVKSDAKPDGLSLTTVLKGDARTLARDAIYWHYPHYANQGSKPGGAVRAGDYKLVEYYENGRRELFNVKQDLSESRNLSADKPDVVKDLAAKLAAWRTEVGAKMPTPNPDYHPNPQAADGTVTLHARSAEVHGVMLRYEPLPHKDTLGFWVNPKDFATWEFELSKPGTFTVEVLQGCGKGSGGSEVEVSSGDAKFTFVVKETGGFQTFEAREVGTLAFDKPGRHTLTVTPVKKPGAAVMDVRQVVLKPGK
ncbi:sulfatase [Fimbriiglobus ruber]|uniref:Choline-sulfatase n=1 Tax=Fimbriiglobus ruber TaxID=1908690 RepID=A0A225D6K2_9BACT|nr:sulfatase [Fimbriiglobus ruber]OWK36613.1 Choline-sulfatase [Fimbriiglobus ruber]